jgi:hypothetical protein
MSDDFDPKKVSDEFLLSIAQYLGLQEEDATSKGSILDALTGPRPEAEEVRSEFAPILQSFQEQSKGYTSAQKEAMGSQQRQQLSEQARSMGGSQRMLSGRSKAMATTMNQSAQAAKQAGVIQSVDAKDKQFKREGEEGLADLEQQIAIASQNRLDDYNKRRADVMLNMEQLIELKRQRAKAESEDL